MTLRTYPAMLAIVFAGLATPALADQTDGEYNGPYIAVSGGLSTHDGDTTDNVVFDTNRDGVYNQNVLTSTGANAFSPGFCNGSSTLNAQTTTPCTGDNDDAEYAVRLGYDARYGDLVMGVMIEGSKDRRATRPIRAPRSALPRLGTALPAGSTMRSRRARGSAMRPATAG